MVTSVPCQLCHQPVALEHARINEYGEAVHEECYVKSLKNQKPVVSESSPDPGTMA